MISAPYANHGIGTREFIIRNNVFKKFYKAEKVLAQLDACNNLGPLGMGILKEKEKIIFQYMSVSAVALLRLFRDSSLGATDKIVSEKPQPRLEENAGHVHPYIYCNGMSNEKYFNIANNYLDADKLNLVNDELAKKSLTMKVYAYRDYYRDAYALFEYCEILLKILHEEANANEADRYTSRPINAIEIVEEDIRIQEYVSQNIYENKISILVSQSIEENKSNTYQFSTNESIDVFSYFFNVEVINYKSEYSIQILETDPLRAFQMHCETCTAIQLSALFLLKFINFYAGNLLNTKSSDDIATLTHYFSEYRIPEAEIVYNVSNENKAQNISLNLFLGSTPLVIINKIKLTLKFDIIIFYLTNISTSDESDQRRELLQNLFDQTMNILLTNNARYKESYLDGIELNSNGNILKPLDMTDSIVESPSKSHYPAIPKPITMLLDPTKLNKLNTRINYLKGNSVFMEFFKVQFVVSEIMSLHRLPLENALDKETLIYANIMLSAAYLLRYLNQVTRGDLAKIFSYPPPTILKLWDENPDLVDKMALVLINIPAVEYQIENKKKESTKAMLFNVRDYYRGAHTLCQYTEILLRQLRGQTRKYELHEFIFKRLSLHVLEGENKKIEIVTRQRDEQNRKGKNKKECKNAYREPEQVVSTQINVVNDFFNQDKMHSFKDHALSKEELQAEVYTTTILSSLFLMKFLNHQSGNTIINTFYKNKEEEILYYFSAYRIPDACYHYDKTGDNHRLVITPNPEQTNIINIINTALNIAVITAEITRIFKIPRVESRNIELKSLYDQTVKLFDKFDMYYKSKNIFNDSVSCADDSILKPIHYLPVLKLSSFPIPEFSVEKKKESKVTKNEMKVTRRVSEDKHRNTDKGEVKDKQQLKILSAAEIAKISSRDFLNSARYWHAEIPALLASAQNHFAELRRRNVKVIAPADLNITDTKLFKEISEVKSHILTLGESIDTLSAQHKDFVIPEISTSDFLLEVESNREVLKQASTDIENLYNKARSLDTIIASLNERINKITQKLQHQESSSAITSTNTAIIQQRLQKKQEQKEAEKRAAAERKKKLEDEKKTKEPKKKLASPPMAPIVTSPSKTVKLFSPTSAKEQKQASTYNPIREKRLMHMDEACQSLIFINKIFEHYCGLDSDVMHFSLLYNIFRCFLALKTYQECGGRQSQELNIDIIKELRHMIIHHGGHAVDNVQVRFFAEDIRNKIPSALLNLKKPYQWKSELTSSQRNLLMEEFGLIQSGIEMLRNPDPFSKVIDDTPFYKKLRQFHEAKTENEVGLEDQDLVLTIYIPLMKSIIATFQKQADYKTNVNLFLHSYLFELQALSMLATLCGELSLGFPALDYKLTDFLSQCYLIRNEVGHELYDLEKLTIFARKIEDKISHVKEQKRLEKKEEPKPLSLPPRRKLG
jgi:hypothetical protein